jgi:hypothetical protein
MDVYLMYEEMAQADELARLDAEMPEMTDFEVWYFGHPPIEEEIPHDLR